MGSKVNKDVLTKKLGIATKVIGNKRIAYPDMNFLTMYAEERKLWYQAIGDGHELLLEVSDFDGEEEVNVEYGRFGSVLKILNDDVELTLEDGGLEVSDGSANAKLASYVVEGLDIDREARRSRIADAEENGYKIEKAPFLDALTYLHGLRGRGTEDELMEDIYFTEEYAFIFDERYIIRLLTKSPIPLVLDGNTAETLIAFLRGESEEYFFLHQREEGKVDFVIGSNYYGVEGLSTFIKDVSQTLNMFTAEEEVTVGLSEFIRFIELATVFLEDDEEDVVCKIDEGQGRILSDTEKNASDGTFPAEGVDGVEIGLNAYDVLTVIGGLRGTVSEQLDLSLNLSEEMAYFKHDKGDCLLSILDRG